MSRIIGMDLGDKQHGTVVLDQATGEDVEVKWFGNTVK